MDEVQNATNNKSNSQRLMAAAAKPPNPPSFDREAAEKYIEQHKLHQLMGNLLRYAQEITHPHSPPRVQHSYACGCDVRCISG